MFGRRGIAVYSREYRLIHGPSNDCPLVIIIIIIIYFVHEVHITNTKYKNIKHDKKLSEI